MNEKYKKHKNYIKNYIHKSINTYVKTCKTSTGLRENTTLEHKTI